MSVKSVIGEGFNGPVKLHCILVDAPDGKRYRIVVGYEFDMPKMPEVVFNALIKPVKEDVCLSVN